MGIRQSDLRGNLKRIFGDDLVGYLFLLPFAIIFAVFYVWPILWAPWMSLQSFSLVGTEFVGLENYRRVFGQGLFLKTLINTFIIAGIVIPAQVILGLFAAILLNSQLVKFRRYIRSGYLVPVVMSTVVLSIIFSLFLSNSGIINQVLQATVGISINWLTDPLLAKFSVALVIIWRRLGISMLIFLAGLQGVPQHLYQAAAIDGASRWQQFRYITVPQLGPVTVLVVVLTTARTLREFAIPFVLTEGGPANESTTVVQVLYQTAFVDLDLGYSAAIGVVFTLILGTILVLQYKYVGGDY